MSAARKPVIVRKLSRDWLAGYAASNPAPDPDLEILDTRGRLLHIDWPQIKWVCYVREIPAEAAADQPERLLRHNFTSRPRAAGLWLRLSLQDGEELEGITANDRSLIEGAGILLTPPDTRSNTQRVFVPRAAIRELTILAVIAPRSPKGNLPEAQPELFAGERDEA